MGAVYLGQHTLLGRRAAIKVLLPALSARPDIVNRFFNEARAVTSISDPGIVQVFDFGYHTDGSAFIVMEFLDGEPLDQRLAKLRRFSAQEALRLCRQVATSLAAAHAQGIIHRDLKPENIFLVRDAEVASGERSKILDFGIAKLSDEHPGRIKTHTGALMGTPVYMSPEQCRGLPEIDHRSDIYALGCVLFHLITGRPPFEGEGMGDAGARRALHGRWEGRRSPRSRCRAALQLALHRGQHRGCCREAGGARGVGREPSAGSVPTPSDRGGRSPGVRCADHRASRAPDRRPGRDLDRRA
jgi:serine/threonine protein kinase